MERTPMDIKLAVWPRDRTNCLRWVTFEKEPVVNVKIKKLK